MKSLRIIGEEPAGKFKVLLGNETLLVSESALKNSRAGRLLLWTYNELSIWEFFRKYPHSKKRFSIVGYGRECYQVAPYNISVIAEGQAVSDVKFANVPTNVVDTARIGRVLVEEWKGLCEWKMSLLVFWVIVQEILTRCCGCSSDEDNLALP